MDTVLKIEGLCKDFGGRNVINHLNLQIGKGEVYGLVGVNGAGKSTLMKLIVNLQKPKEGSILLFGKSFNENGKRIFNKVSATIETPVFYEDLTGEKNLEIVCKYMGIDPKESIEEVKKIINLSGLLNKKAKDLSLGMRERLAIARGLLNNPEFVILDEPTNGLDPIKIDELIHIIKKLKKERGTSFLIASHMLDELEDVADKIGFLSNGTIVKEMDIYEIAHEKREYIEIICSDLVKSTYVLEGKLGITDYKVAGDNIIRLYDMGADYNKAICTLIESGIRIESFSKKTRRLQEYFMETATGGNNNA